MRLWDSGARPAGLSAVDGAAYSRDSLIARFVLKLDGLPADRWACAGSWATVPTENEGDLAITLPQITPVGNFLAYRLCKLSRLRKQAGVLEVLVDLRLGATSADELSSERPS